MTRWAIMSVLTYLRPENGPVGSVLATWFDRVPSGLATLFLLLWFVFFWTAFQIISQGSAGLHPDLTEVYAWGLHPSAGYYKHPPLSGLIAATWFALFPPADWAFHLLAMTNAALGLFATDLISRRYLDGDKRIVVLLLLLLTPFYQFHGQRFGANQTLLSTWPIATYCFLRAFQTRGLVWSTAAGAAAAFVILGKYYSIFLIAGFVAAVLAHPRAPGLCAIVVPMDFCGGRLHRACAPYPVAVRNRVSDFQLCDRATRARSTRRSTVEGCRLRRRSRSLCERLGRMLLDRGASRSDDFVGNVLAGKSG
jgi:hypothetical protein